jgi:predicted transposase/invertase (TIGR01784 family)
LGRAVRSAAVRNAELPGRDVDVKQERFDVNCLFEDGDQAAVEMQAEPMRGDGTLNGHRNMRERAAFGLCDLHASQPGSGVDYADFVKSYHVTITNYRMYGEERGLVETFKLRNESGIVLTESVVCVFVDLTLAAKAAKKQVEEMSGTEMWAVFLAKAGKPQYASVIKQILERREGIKVAEAMLRDISQDEYERARFHSRKMAMRDAEHNRAVEQRKLRELAELRESIDKSKAELRELMERREIIDRGIAEGKKAKTIEIARKLLERGFDASDVSDISGLSPGEIENLRNCDDAMQ